MAVVGHWASLAEAQKLTQSELLAGIVQEIVESGQLIAMLPVKQVSGKSLIYNREKTWTVTDGGDFFDIHEQIPWSADVDYDQIEVELKRIARQDIIDNFLAETYNNINDYRALLISQVRKRLQRFYEDKLIYGDKDNVSSKEFDGLHAFAAENSGDLNIDMAQGALALSKLRKLINACKVRQANKPGCFFLLPNAILDQISAGYQEAGFVRSSVTHALGSFTIGGRELGGRILTFDGIPLIPTDFLVAEEATTGLTTANSRDKNTTVGTEMFSIFLICPGQTEDGGMSLLFGGQSVGGGEFKPFMHTSFDKLENYDAGGERLVGYVSAALGATHSLGRITDIADVAVIP